MKDGSDNNKLMGMISEIGCEVIRPRRRAKQSWPLFWILGFLGSCLFIFCGICLITGFIEETKKDPGMLYCGIFFLLLGLGLLAAVIGTFWKLIMKDSYTVPEVPIVNVSPTSEEGRKKTIKEQMAMRELQKTD